LSKYIFQKFVEQDNQKIVSIIKHLFVIYHRCAKIKKQKYFFKYIKAAKNYQNCKYRKRNIYNRLYNESKVHQKLINKLEQKFYQNEEEICTFSPKINSFAKKLINNKESLFNDFFNKSLSKINNNGNNINKQNVINKTNTIKVLNNFRNKNSFLYKGHENSKTNENEYKINRRNACRAQMMKNYYTNKNIIPINYYKLIDNNFKEDKNKLLFLNSFNFLS
jgi:hypothetical protein